MYGTGHSPSREKLTNRASIMFLIDSSIFMSHLTLQLFGPHGQVWSQPHSLASLVLSGWAGQSVSGWDEDIGYISIFSSHLHSGADNQPASTLASFHPGSFLLPRLWSGSRIPCWIVESVLSSFSPGVLGIKFRPSGLGSKHLTCWAMPLALTCIIKYETWFKTPYGWGHKIL